MFQLASSPDRARVRGHTPKTHSDAGLAAVIRDTTRLCRAPYPSAAWPMLMVPTDRLNSRTDGVRLVDPPGVALAPEVADDELGRRMPTPPYGIDDRCPVVAHARGAHVVPSLTCFDEGLRGTEIRRHGIADTARVEHAHASDGAIQRPVRVPDAHQVGLRIVDQRTELCIGQGGVDAEAVIEPGRHVGGQQAGPIRQDQPLFGGKPGQPVEPTGGGHDTPGPGEAVRHLHRAGMSSVRAAASARLGYGHWPVTT